MSPRRRPHADAKQAVRERIWRLLEERGVARFPGARGRIPNFVGAEAAARVLTGLPEWRAARVVKVNPDAPQLPVRTAALEAGKLLYVAVPRLRTERPFQALDPARLSVAARRAASIKGAAAHGRPVGPGEMRPVELVVCGSVAVDRRGARVGKGGGYSDLELALLVEHGLVDEAVRVVTTVHPLQVSAHALPQDPHDLRLHRIVTPDGSLTCRTRRAPKGILWGELDDDRLAAIPALRALAGT